MLLLHILLSLVAIVCSVDSLYYYIIRLCLYPPFSINIRLDILHIFSYLRKTCFITYNLSTTFLYYFLLVQIKYTIFAL